MAATVDRPGGAGAVDLDQVPALLAGGDQDGAIRGPALTAQDHAADGEGQGAGETIGSTGQQHGSPQTVRSARQPCHLVEGGL
ncbi:MAG TPA: hypothetical protein PKX00_13180, partial [Opitutaceae bacterium]|nr:hypothetical protein [Opitutaceae bacterium]